MARERNHTNKTTFRGLKQPRLRQRRNENHIDRTRNFAGLKRNQDFHDARKKSLANRREEFLQDNYIATKRRAILATRGRFHNSREVKKTHLTFPSLTHTPLSGQVDNG
jgi:hypothetical protein